eukprot:7271857-Pyramimonas_sp.AAC.1
MTNITHDAATNNNKNMTHTNTTQSTKTTNQTNITTQNQTQTQKRKHARKPNHTNLENTKGTATHALTPHMLILIITTRGGLGARM